MRHDFAGREQAAFWLHVVFAAVLPGYLIRGEGSPSGGWWMMLVRQMSTIESLPDSLVPQPTPQVAGKSAARPSPGNVIVTNASLFASTSRRKEGP